jgi:hypothetical protein
MWDQVERSGGLTRMQRKLPIWTQATSFLFLYFAASSPALSQESWYKLHTPDDRFSIEMPSQPEHVEEQRTVASGTYTQHRYVSRLGRMTFVVFTGVFPDATDISDTRSYLEKTVAILVSNDKYKFEDVSWRKIQNLDALEFTAIREKVTQARSISLFAGYGNIAATFSGPLGSATSPEAKRFIESLRVEAAQR